MKLGGLFLLLFLLCQCEPPETSKCEACQVTDPRIVGKWKLIEECACYSLGGDFIWRKVTKDLTFSFSDQCDIISGGDVGTDCSQGKYGINQDKINVTWICSNGGIVTDNYQYLFNSKNDTLVIRGFVEEGYYGSKFYRE